MINKGVTITLLLLLFAFINPAFAQKPPIKFGKVSMDEMKMTVYDKDSTAEAVILADYGDSEIKYSNNIGFQLIFKTHVRIKILKKEGLEKANHTIRLYVGGSKDETVGGFKACTYNLEGGKIVETKLSKKDIFREEESKKWVLKKFALSNVKVGSVIEYQYTVYSSYFYNLQNWYFQSDIPTIWSEYRTSIPEYFDYKKIVGGYISPAINETKTYSGTIPGYNINYSKEFQRMVYKDVPAFKNEKYITTPKDYLAKIEFELRSTQMPNSMVETYSTTWKAIVNDLMESQYFGSALNRKGIVKDLSEKINPADAPQKKLVAAYYLIKNHMKWNEKYGVYINNTLRDAYNKNEGNTAEINLLLVNLLRAVGIQAHPVLISTRKHGRINTFYPRLSALNSVIALAVIDGKNVLLDATVGYLKPGELSFNSLNGKGLVALKDKTSWVELLGGEKRSETTMIMATINEEQFAAQIARSYKSLSATIKRNQIAKDGKEKFIENYKEKNTDWEIEEHAIENEKDATKPLNEKIKVGNFSNIDASSDIIYLPAVLTDEVEENPFKSETRKYPVDFASPVLEKTIINIAIPEGFNVEELPEAINAVLPNKDASFFYQAKKIGKNIQVMSQLTIKKKMFLPEEYHLLKELFSNMIEKHGEQIVLKRIEE